MMIGKYSLALIALGGGLVTGLGQVQPVFALNLLIDDFVSPHSATTGINAAPFGTGNSLNPTTSALGVERDLWVQKTIGGGGPGTDVTANLNPGGLDLLRMTIGDARGSTYVTWDGVDGNPNPFTGVDYNGLGVIDFSGAENLDIIVTFSDLGGPIKFKFWDADDLSGNTFAETTFTVPSSIPSGSPVLLSQAFSGFSATGDSLDNILDSVGAIQMWIDATAEAQEGWDMRLDLVQTTMSATTPEPTSIFSILTLGMMGAGSLLKRNKG